MSKFGQNTLFHFVSTCPKKIVYKKIDDSCHGFSCCWTSSFRVELVFKCTQSRYWMKESFVQFCCATGHCPSVPKLVNPTVKIQHATALIKSCGNHVQQLRCALSRMFHQRQGHRHAISKFFLCCRNHGGCFFGVK